jgi:hypothetical protein
MRERVTCDRLFMGDLQSPQLKYFWTNAFIFKYKNAYYQLYLLNNIAVISLKKTLVLAGFETWSYVT